MWAVVATVVVLLSGGCSTSSDAAAPTTRSVSVSAPASSIDDDSGLAAHLVAAWQARFSNDDPAGLPFHGAARCAANAASSAIGAERLIEADVSPQDISGGESLIALDASDAEVNQFANELNKCDLAASYTWQIRRIMPAFISEEDATCVGASIAGEPDYSHLLAESVLRQTTDEWLDAVDPLFRRSLIACPSAYVTITLGPLERDYGPLPEAGVSCVKSQLVTYVDRILGDDADVADAAVQQAFGPCLDDLGKVGQILRAEFS